MAKDEFDVVICKCIKCDKIKKISLDKRKEIRYTYCIDCGEAVIWEKEKVKIEIPDLSILNKHIYKEF